MFTLLAKQAFSRDLRELHVAEEGDGDCFTSSCSFDYAANHLRLGDTIFFENKVIHITSFPSPMSTLLHTAMFMNVTFKTNVDTVFDGQLMAGESLFNEFSASLFRWIKIIGFRFENFNKPIITRLISENQWPLAIFKHCTFENCTEEIFKLKGGTFHFYNCIFRNNLHRPFKVTTETMLLLSDCTFEKSESSFFFDCDLIIRNCVFSDNFGGRGGALYLSKVTLDIDGTKFIRNHAKTHGGAIYIRESPEQFKSEIRNACFFNNTADGDGDGIYSYWSDFEISGSSFTKEEDKEVFKYKSNINAHDNQFSNDCKKCLQHQAQTNDFDPFTVSLDDQIDVVIDPMVVIDL